MLSYKSGFLWHTAVVLFLFIGGGATQAAEQAVRFNRDIRPILSDNCFHCHGPDSGQRKAGLRLDTLEDATAALKSGRRALAPGDLAASELISRITAHDPDDRMPPVDSGRKLTEQQIALLTRWVEQGAEYEKHWAFVPPVRPALPPVTRGDWVRNPVDRFILARLEREGLSPSDEADKRLLIRRVSLDLTGLPPTPAEVGDFLDDESPNAYETLVARLLDSPRYGERMALPWLDAARYADTHGYLFDTERFQWRWRDWVIAALNRNQPFDRFTIEQLAGDMLPNATLDQQIASGFNRNHVINTEFGAIPEEYYAENIFDRVETTATVWLGLTMQCARCHDHKYDPITQKEYYQLYAFFNNVPELGVELVNRNGEPAIPAPTDVEQWTLDKISSRIAQVETELREDAPAIHTAQLAWENDFRIAVEPVTGELAYWALNGDLRDSAGRESGKFEAGEAAFKPGLLAEAVAFDGKAYIQAGRIADFDTDQPMSLAAWVRPEQEQGRQTLISRIDYTGGLQGYALQIEEGLLSLSLVHKFPEAMAVAKTKAKVHPNKWHHVAATYDGSGKAAGITLYVNGVKQEVDYPGDTLTGSFAGDRPLHIGKGPGGPFKGLMDELRVYDRSLTQQEIHRLPGVTVQTWLAMDPAVRTAEQARIVREYFLKHHGEPEWRNRIARIQSLREEHAGLLRSVTTVMVMKEVGSPRGANILERGAYTNQGEKTAPVTPAVLPPMPEKQPGNRLGLARWLTDPSHPLTARVVVNRYWQMYFGTGLVKTTEDFGYQGEWPSHPELLDWLATEFVRTGWDVKRLQRLIVTSAAYRQSSRTAPGLLDRDPDNRLLARGPRLRLDAEFIRDQAMAVSGLLGGPIGGPSVKPYEPAALWLEVAFDVSGKNLTGQVYVQDQGQSLYRRGLYTFWKRNSPPATLQAFDAPDRERCNVRRDRTNTPLQALVVMNDPTYVEASRKLAERMMHAEGSPAQRIAHGFAMLTARTPVEQELAPLVAMFERQRSRFTSEGSSAEALLGVGESPRDPTLDPAELAAYAVIANILLNLDESLTKG